MVIYMKEESVSVVIPMYNAERTIIDTLDSVKNQTYITYIKEIFVIDDGSTDSSEQCVAAYMQSNPELPVTYIKQKNAGVSSARNHGIRLSTSKWVALLDSDDAWHSDKLEKQIEAVKNHPEIVFLGTGHLNKPFVRKGKVIRELYKADLYDLFWSFFPVTPSVLFRRDAVKTVGYFDETQSYCEDMNYYMRFVVHCNYYYLPEKLVDIDLGKNFHGEKGLTSNLQGMHQGEMKNLRELRDEKYVSVGFYVFFCFFLMLKYWRRRIRHKITCLRKK